MHERAGLRVSASSATAEPGTVVVLGLGTAAIGVSAPCRVVYVIDEPGRRGFASGLVRHAEAQSMHTVSVRVGAGAGVVLIPAGISR